MALSTEALLDLSASYVSGISRPVNWRRKQLQGVHDLIHDNTEALVGAALDDKRLTRADLLLELNYVLSLIRSQLDIVIGSASAAGATKNVEPDLLSGSRARKLAEVQTTAGVVLVSSTWAFPYSSSLGGLVLTYASGNVAALALPASVKLTALLGSLLKKYVDHAGYSLVDSSELAKDIPSLSATPSAPSLVVLDVNVDGSVEPLRTVTAPTTSSIAYVNYSALGKRGGRGRARTEAAKKIARDLVQSKVLFQGRALFAPFIVYVDIEAYHDLTLELIAAAKEFGSAIQESHVPLKTKEPTGIRTLVNNAVRIIEIEPEVGSFTDLPSDGAPTLVIAKTRSSDAAIDGLQSLTRIPALYLYSQEPFTSYIVKNVDADRILVNGIALDLLANPFAIETAKLPPSLTHSQTIIKSAGPHIVLADSSYQLERQLLKSIAGASISRLDEGDGTRWDFFDQVKLVFQGVKLLTYTSVALGGYLAYRRYTK
ncbi:hypothetical protein DENSPDRAFT_835301 [Dentipellis sp. KUC8613]|nr:hypothetical protein DENSPDRAFT_835301 [Dentipellis sp. KUC8613]